MTGTADRTFQLWEYRVGHAQMLIRSPKDDRHGRNVDIVLAGVDYIELPTVFRGIDVVLPTREDMDQIERRYRSNVDPSSVCVLVSENRRYLVVAAGWKVFENDVETHVSTLESFELTAAERRQLVETMRRRGDLDEADYRRAIEAIDARDHLDAAELKLLVEPLHVRHGGELPEVGPCP